MAVGAVTSEPLSTQFPVEQGKNREKTGNIRHSAIKSKTSVTIPPCFQRVALDFPKTRNRESKMRIREFRFPVTSSKHTLISHFSHPHSLDYPFAILQSGPSEQGELRPLCAQTCPSN
jgi:hypothetical protein